MFHRVLGSWSRAGRVAVVFGVLGLLAIVGAGCEEKGLRITQIVPNYGRAAGGEEVFIHGSGYGPGLTVQFGQRNASSLVIESSSKLKVTTPPSNEGPTDVIITLDNGKTIALKNGFRVEKTHEYEQPKKKAP